MSKLTDAWLYEPKYCPSCGKEFYPTPKWAYRDGAKRYCSWSCLKRHYDNIKSYKNRKYRYKRVEQLELDGTTVVAVYDTPFDAGFAVNGNTQSIYDACRLGRKYKKYLWRYAESKKEDVTTDDK